MHHSASPQPQQTAASQAQISPTSGADVITCHQPQQVFYFYLSAHFFAFGRFFLFSTGPPAQKFCSMLHMLSARLCSCDTRGEPLLLSIMRRTKKKDLPTFTSVFFLDFADDHISIDLFFFFSYLLPLWRQNSCYSQKHAKQRNKKLAMKHLKFGGKKDTKIYRKSAMETVFFSHLRDTERMRSRDQLSKTQHDGAIHLDRRVERLFSSIIKIHIHITAVDVTTNVRPRNRSCRALGWFQKNSKAHYQNTL